jgi:sugar phosphate isomerase/epimerase
MFQQTRRGFLKSTASTALGTALAMEKRLASAAAENHRWRFAICNETFKDWPHERAFAFAAECGYQGIEIAPFTFANDVREISPAKRGEIRSLAKKNGLEVIGLHWLLAKTEGYYLTSPDPQVRRKTADYFGELARFCADLGGKLMVLGSPKQRSLLPGVSRADAMKYAADTLRMALPALDAAGVTMALEPLSPKTTTFMNTAADGAELAGLVNSPRCRLQLDCLAMSNEPTPIPELIRKHHSLLVHFHANDTNSQGPGFGTIDFVPVFKALRDINYRGWVSVEIFDYKPGPERIARESIAHMKKCVGELVRQTGA